MIKIIVYRTNGKIIIETNATDDVAEVLKEHEITKFIKYDIHKT